jgi:hypothetical protein
LNKYIFFVCLFFVGKCFFNIIYSKIFRKQVIDAAKNNNVHGSSILRASNDCGFGVCIYTNAVITSAAKKHKVIAGPM